MTGLLAVWPITDETYTRDALIAEGLDDLPAVAAEAGVRVIGPSTWRVLDAEELEGWEHWPGLILVATAPAEIVEPAWRRRRAASRAA
ncbi:hypothetical protein ACIA8K_06920 [Catenuloplanes sp. NPDC051500]|uniref:hypothetical protein n=1 Tax=Catenuloplanes sp. NPDC051500 TaxID=3363959 RepID=UPI0037B11A65